LLGRNGQTYNTNQIEVISSISNEEEQTNHSSSTSSLVSTTSFEEFSV